MGMVKNAWGRPIARLLVRIFLINGWGRPIESYPSSYPYYFGYWPQCFSEVLERKKSYSLV